MKAENFVMILEAVESQMLESTIREDLTVNEIISLYIIDRLHQPTIVEFAKRVHISQSNATYIIRKLIEKGYLTKLQHPEDKREYRLYTTEKFHRAIDYSQDMVPRLEEDVLPHLNGEDRKEFDFILKNLENMYEKPAG